jgi:hypothetical protein
MSEDLEPVTRWGRRLGIGAAVVFGLLVAAGGFGFTQDGCNIGCDTKPFRDAMGYAAMFLGGLAAALGLWGRPVVSMLPSLLGLVALVVAFVEGMSHLR